MYVCNYFYSYNISQYYINYLHFVLFQGILKNTLRLLSKKTEKEVPAPATLQTVAGAHQILHQLSFISLLISHETSVHLVIRDTKSITDILSNPPNCEVQR
jgi:hypothetical protein